jgi:hypothetical protein
MLRRKEMKQIIVLIAMILLGITIAGFVTDFSGSADSLAKVADDKIDSITSTGEF